MDTGTILAWLAAALIVGGLLALLLLPSANRARAWALFLGVATDPQLVAAVRGFVLLALPIGSGIALAWVNGWTDPRLLPLIPAAALAIRALEGGHRSLL